MKTVTANSNEVIIMITDTFTFVLNEQGEKLSQEWVKWNIAGWAQGRAKYNKVIRIVSFPRGAVKAIMDKNECYFGGEGVGILGKVTNKEIEAEIKTKLYRDGATFDLGLTYTELELRDLNEVFVSDEDEGKYKGTFIGRNVVDYVNKPTEMIYSRF